MAGTASPTFSVVVPTRDRAHLLERALRSVLAQSESDFEVVVVDDGSTDDTAARVEALGDDRIRFVSQPPAGAGVARNHGAELARGEHLTFLDSDDEVLPTWLERFAAAQREQDFDILSCGYVDRWPPEAGLADETALPTDLSPLFPGVQGSFVHSGAFVLRRSLFLEVGGYSTTRALQHTELSYRLLPYALERDARIGAIPDALLIYYLASPDSITSDRDAVLDGYLFLLEHHGELLRRDPVRLANYQAIAAVRAARLGRSALARRLFAAAVRTRPIRPIGWARFGASLAPAAAQRRIWKAPPPIT